MSSGTVQLWVRNREGAMCIMLTDMPESTVRKIAENLDKPGTKRIANELRKILKNEEAS